MRFDASRVPRRYRLLGSPATWAQSGDLACATDVFRNENAGQLDKGLMWCADPDTLAEHMAETAANSGKI